jgi:hypothetical protein
MRSYKKCQHYDPRAPWQCMRHDLCMERDIPDCPVRTRWGQGIAERDEDYAACCGGGVKR